MGIRPLSALTVGLLALAGGCKTADATKTVAKKPDVTQPGVLPPPQETMRPGGGAVVPAGGIQPMAVAPAPVTPSFGSSLAKITAKPEKKIPASEMALAWRNNIEYLPDPSRNGALGPGIAGQLFLYGGPKLEFALADGTLTVDLIDETPRAPAQPAATPERWQFDKHMLRNLRTTDETFGKSYVLFLPWPAYKPDVTRVKISARYDPDNGHTLFAKPATLTIDKAAPKIDMTSNRMPIEAVPNALPPVNQAPIPIGGGPRFGPPPAGSGLIPLGGGSANTVPPANFPLSPLPPAGAYGAPITPAVPAAPAGVTPPTPAIPEGALPIFTTIDRK